MTPEQVAADHARIDASMKLTEDKLNAIAEMGSVNAVMKASTPTIYALLENSQHADLAALETCRNEIVRLNQLETFLGQTWMKLSRLRTPELEKELEAGRKFAKETRAYAKRIFTWSDCEHADTAATYITREHQNTMDAERRARESGSVGRLSSTEQS